MILCDELVKIYKMDDLEVVALQGLDLKVADGELMGIIGASGSGKSTLLNMLGGLDRPSAGKLQIDGKDMLRMTEKDLVRYKLETVGFVWQNNARNLIPYLTALQNVELPMLIKGSKKRTRATELLEAVGLKERMNNRLTQLSGGEQQRVAIAIALANSPRLLLADEPTGSVDSKTADMIMDIFRKLNKEMGLTVVIVTHDTELAQKVDRVVAIRDGKTSSEILRRIPYEEMNESLAEEEKTQQQNDYVELAVLDKAGRMQIPREYLNQLDMKDQNKMQVKLVDGQIILTPAKQRDGSSAS
ncbi:ABC transporter ATP-binding protein [Salipaludibacillus sp. HK11]|uniref:ABC transporter ATP-binding protein n=1 Tax=Salipaludibacillus sp. HK11 TaxID=3394320 RepID=UPI0039FD0B5F